SEFLLLSVYKDYKRTKQFGLINKMLEMEKIIDELYRGEIWRFVPGKQLLQLFLFYLVKDLKGKAPIREDFEMFASHICELSELDYLRTAIFNYLQKKNKNLAV